MRIYLDEKLKRKWRKARWDAGLRVAVWRDPDVDLFFKKLRSSSGGGNNLSVLPRQRIIYAIVLKAASSRIRRTLCIMAGMRSRSLNPWRWHRIGSPPRMMSIAPGSFYKLAHDPTALRFSFMRNPYDRLVSCWADKFQDQPLIESRLFTKGSRMIDQYLKMRAAVDPSLPRGAGHTLSFPDFVNYATAYGYRGNDGHMRAQTLALDLPGISFDFIGKVESFEQDFIRVLDHVNATENMRRMAIGPVNTSRRSRARQYYTQEMADRVYRAYEADFDRGEYLRALPG